MANNISGASAKFGRNATKCVRYRLECRREKSRTTRLARHLAMNPKDVQARGAVERFLDGTPVSHLRKLKSRFGVDFLAWSK